LRHRRIFHARKRTDDILCYEIVIPNELRGSEALGINETNITLFLMDEELCDVLPNNDTNPSCGDENKIEWNIVKLSSVSNVVVEYDSESEMILVS